VEAGGGMYAGEASARLSEFRWESVESFRREEAYTSASLESSGTDGVFGRPSDVTFGSMIHFSFHSWR
jgi:hypothetical protein